MSERPSVPFVDLAAQYAAIRREIDAAVASVFGSGDFILGREVSLFEDEFAAYCGVQHAVGVDSGTSALELALRAYGIGRGDEVITAANTFIATALAISYVGAAPVLVDIDPCTYAMDPAAVESAVTSRTSAIIPVHLYGHPADMDAIRAVATRHGLLVIEDACQAHGALYGGRRAGSLAHAAAFSFYPAKNLGACGDGGMIVTEDAQVRDAVRMMRDYGQRAKYDHVLKGYNRRLDTLQAAVLRVKLRHLDAWNRARRQHARRYDALLEGSAVVPPCEAEDVEAVYHLYVVRTADRDALRGHLAERGIATGIHYPVPIHLQAAYRDLRCPAGSFPITEAYSGQVLSLPMYAECPAEAIAAVAAAVRAFGDGRDAPEAVMAGAPGAPHEGS